MGIKSYNPYTPSRRHMTGSDFSEITKSTPEKSLTVSLKKNDREKEQSKTNQRAVGLETGFYGVYTFVYKMFVFY